MNPQQIKNRLNEALTHHKAGRLDRAETLYRQLAPLVPRDAIVYQLWGQLAEQQARYEDAIRYYTQALRIEPTSVHNAVRLGSVFIATSRLADAESVMRRIVERVPNSHEAWNALGFALKVRSKLVEALACHKRAVELNPKYVEGWLHYGLTFGSACKNTESVKYYDKALELDPNCWMARYGRAQSLHKLYRVEEAIADYDAVLRAQPRHLEARSFRLFALLASDTLTREQLFEEHRAYGRATEAGPAMLPGYEVSPHRRLRLAILSPDLRTHSCAYFLEPLLQHFDRTQFEVVLYMDHFIEDEVSARLKTYGVLWRNFVGQPQNAVEKIIRGDRPDVMLDLTGHIGSTIRMPLYARRLAPVQITYLGYPDTTGVPNMDFRFTDAIADPVGDADRFATETLVRFAPTAWSYLPPPEAPAVAPLPLRTTGRVTFGCFNSPTKFTDTLYRAWAKLLAAVPNSRLLVKGRDFEEAPVRDLIFNRMRACGLPVERIELAPRTPTTAEHLAYYANVDIALDTFPYTGTTTTCEALWMGRPVVTWCGARHASRVSASLLTAVGHPEWIAHSEDEYVRLAQTLAADPARLEGVSARLRADMAGSVLMDHRGQSARFQATVRECWIAKTSAPVAACA